MRRVSLAGLALIGALLLAIPSAFAKSDVQALDPGITSKNIVIRADSGRHEGVLQLHQLSAGP